MDEWRRFLVEKMEPLNKFQVPFFIYQLDLNKQLQILNIFTCNKKNLEKKDPVSDVYTDFFASKNYLPDVIEILQEELADLYLLAGFRNPIISQVWMQQYTKGCFMTPHNHGMTGFSAIYYIKFDPEEHEATRFISPVSDFINGDNHEFRPEVNKGTLIFFPSMLMHYVRPNQSDKPRAILSFNIDERL